MSVTDVRLAVEHGPEMVAPTPQSLLRDRCVADYGSVPQGFCLVCFWDI